jgi:hypothetical protein
VLLFSLSSSCDNKFHLGEGLYLKNKITTAEKRTKLLPSRGRTIYQTKQSIKAYCLLFVYFYTAPNSLE